MFARTDPRSHEHAEMAAVASMTWMWRSVAIVLLLVVSCTTQTEVDQISNSSTPASTPDQSPTTITESTEPDGSEANPDAPATTLESDDPEEESGSDPSPSLPPSAGVIFDGSPGGSDPADVVQKLLVALNAGDILGGLAMIDPAERDLIADLYVTARDASMDAWPSFTGDQAIADLEPEVIALTPLRVVRHSDYLAWVETDELELWMAAPTEVAAAVFNDGEPWLAENGWTREETVVAMDDMGAVAELFAGDSDLLPGLITTEIDGKWYVSFGRTLLEILRVDAEFTTVFPVDRLVVTPQPAASPVEALDGLLRAVAEDRMVDAAALLVPAEAQAFADYPDILQTWLADLLEVAVSVDLADMQVVEEAAGRSVVELTTLNLHAATSEDDPFDGDASFDVEFELADQCLVINDDPTWCTDNVNSATQFTSMYNDLGWQGLRFVTVEVDGGWALSIYETIAFYGTQLFVDPLFAMSYSLRSIDIELGPIGVTLINETAKTLQVQRDGTITLTPFARDRILIARIAAANDGVLYIDPALIGADCDSIVIWNIDMVTNDWGEEPDYYDYESCDRQPTRPLEIPGGVDLTLVIWGYSRWPGPIEAEIR